MSAVTRLVCSPPCPRLYFVVFVSLTAGVAFRDRNAGRDSNRTKTTDEAPRGGRRGNFRGKLQSSQEISPFILAQLS